MYITLLSPPDLHYYPYKQLDYITPPERCFGPSMEVIVVPVTFVNAGARSTVVEAVSLEIRDRDHPERTRRFSPAATGTWGLSGCDYVADLRSYSPIPVEGRASVRENIVLFPEVEPKPRIIAPSGRYEFRFNFTERHNGPNPFVSSDEVAVRALEPMMLTIGDFKPDDRPHGLYPENELPSPASQAKD